MWDTGDLDKLIVDLGEAGPKAEGLCRLVVAKTGFDTVAGGQARVPVDTGNLKNSIGVDFDEDEMGFEAGPTASYGGAVEYGSRPHEIRARNAKALHWVDADGNDVFRRRVMHPGGPPQPYMRPAFEQAVEPLPEILGQVGEKALE